MYRSSDHQKITPYHQNVFGATYNDANSTYYAEQDYGVISFDGDITTIGDWAFTNSTTLTAVAWPNTVTDIGYEAFKGWTSLTNLTIKAGSIENNAFQNCTNLNTITFGKGVTSIKDNAFATCTNVTSVTFSGVVVLDNASLSDIGTAESPAALKIPSTWLANDRLVNSTTLWHSGYFNCEYADPVKEFLGEMAEPCTDCPTVEIKKGDKTVRLYNPEKVEFKKQ